MSRAAVMRERGNLLRHTSSTVGLLGLFFAFFAAPLADAPSPDAPDRGVTAVALAYGFHSLTLLLAAVLKTAWPSIASVGFGVAALWALAGDRVLTEDGQLTSWAIPAALLLTTSIPAAAPALLAKQNTRPWVVALCVLATGTPLTIAGFAAVPLAGASALGWLIMVGLGAWLLQSFPRTAAAVAEIGRAHEAERRASELETQRRQGARLLHDTVLATLTLLAHSGVGVPEESLRAQARSDAQLLRQLREGWLQPQAAPGEEGPDDGNEASLGARIQELITRFEKLGLTVTLVGDEQPSASRASEDAFMLALNESLENVRRHSQVDEATLTLKQDEHVIRALVSDSGVGFHLDHVESDHLGVKESMQARLQEIGGNARLFSAPGSGTTVVLEVPR